MRSDPRRLALETLDAVERGRAHLDLVLDRMPLSELSPRDRRLFNAMVFGVLRWRGRLDYILARLSKTPLRKIRPEVLNLLRLGLFQIVYLERVPDAAAVNTAVDICKSLAPTWVVRFVNGLLRNACRRHPTIEMPDVAADPLEALAVEQSMPAWLVTRWLGRYGLDECRRFCDAHNTIPPVTLRANAMRCRREQLQQRLSDRAKEVVPGALAPESLRLRGLSAPVDALPGFSQGWFQVQDEAAQLVTALLAPRPGETVLDACAGQGGKTGHIGQLMENRGRLVALDADRRRLERIAPEMRRLGIEGVRTALQDLEQPLAAAVAGPYDRVLLDAPCSGLGVLRRNPDTKWRLPPDAPETCGRRQLRLLERLALAVKSGGVLVYAVCSTEPEENEAVVDAFLERHPQFAADCRTGFLTAAARELVGPDGWLRCIPHRHQTDGFFAARLQCSGRRGGSA